MSNIDKLSRDLTQTIKDGLRDKQSAYDTQAEVRRIDGNIAWVHIPGGVEETPVLRTIDAGPGDIVTVRIAKGKGWIGGNSTNPPISNTTLNNFAGKSVAFFDSLSAKNITANDIKAATGYIGNLTADNIQATDIITDHAAVNSLYANYAHITNGVIDNATIGYADVNDLHAHYATIDFENVNNSWITNGTIKNAAISDAMISGVSANKLTAGTIDASNITVTNLNASNITAGSITVDGITIDVANNEASIDGACVEDGTITLSGLAQEVTDKIDGAIESFTGSAVPTLNNYPASSWSADERASHVGDVYYVVNSAITEDGYCYRFTHSNNAYSWTLIKDSDVTAALSRLTTAEGNITNLQTFESNTESWITDTDDEISSLQQRTTTLETDMDDKVDVTTFNTLSQSVDTNTSNITSLSTTVQNKADSSTVTTLSNTVSTVQQTANDNSSTLSNLTTVLGTNSDGTTKTTDVVHRTSALEQDLSGFKTTVASTYYTQTDASALTGRVTSAESNITQNANAITTKVSQDGVISSINQSPESVTIDASRVNVTGIIQVGGIATTTQVDDAATKATNYLTPNGTGTVKVHPQTDTTNYVQIGNTGMTIYKGGNDMAFFGETARIGRNASGFSRTEIASTGVQFLRGNTVLANIGYGSGKSQSGSTANAPFYSFGERFGDIGNYSMAEGNGVTASGYTAHAEGRGSIASGIGAHAEGGSSVTGWGPLASGDYSHAEGTHTVASSYCAHAEGNYTQALHQGTHSQNVGTIASKWAQTAMGKYNVEDPNQVADPDTLYDRGKYALIIGNGRSVSNRSNAFTVGWNGDVDIASGAKYKINGSNLSASDVGAVPTSRTVNGKALSANISLTASDVGAIGASPSCIEFTGVSSSASHGGYIDFHNRGSSADYTSRIIEDSSAHLKFYADNGVDFTGGASFAGGISSGGYFKSTYTYNNPGGASATTVKQNTIYVSSNGNFIKGNSASSRRYKHNIKELINEDLDPNLLYKIPIIQFVYNTEYLGNKKDCRYLKTLPGFIAEDIYDIYPVAADISDEGSIEGWNEHYIIPPMLALIQDQHKEIELLKQEINQLKQ